MISTNPHLPLNGASRCINETPMDPLHDECSGMDNLNAYFKEEVRRTDQRAIMLAIGLIAGALIVWLMVISFT